MCVWGGGHKNQTNQPKIATIKKMKQEKNEFLK